MVQYLYPLLALLTFFVHEFTADQLAVKLIGSFQNNQRFSIGRLMPGYDLAIKEISEQYGFNVTFTPFVNNITCDDMERENYQIAKYFFTEWDQKSLLVILGVGCNEMVHLAPLAREWNTLMLLSSSASTPLLHDHQQFPTLLSFNVADYPSFVKLAIDFFISNQWKNLAIIYDVSEKFPDHSITAGSFRYYAARKMGQLDLTYLSANSSRPLDANYLLQKAKQANRVIVLLFQAERIREIMIAASREGMVTPDYAFFMMNLFKSPARFGQLTWKNGDEDDVIAKEAFQKLYLLQGSCFSTEHPSLQDVAKHIKQEGIDRYQIAYRPNEQVLAEEYMNGSFEQWRDGSYLATKFIRRPFKVKGVEFLLGTDGFLELDGCVGHFNNFTGEMEVAIVADFSHADYNRTGTAKWVRFQNKSEFAFPKNEPECGFNNQKCRAVRSDVRTVIAAVTVSAVSLVAVLFGFGYQVYRIRIRSWLIPPEELTFPKLRTSYSSPLHY